MTVHEQNLRASSVRFEHSGRSIPALEWSTATSKTTLLVAVDGDVAELVGPLAEQLIHRNRVVGVNLSSAWDPVTVAWYVAEPVVLVAQGKAGRIACDAARLAPGAIRALILADVAPDAADITGLPIPVLVFHGRESMTESHAQAVKEHGDIPGSHIIELDGCAELPTMNCATALAESLAWYLDNLGNPVMEFMDFAGAHKEPIDPKA